ncbi:unnamed protein product [Bursaphelenchus xylophilus]|uniref:(pine wood nematode) hypothetical protein n=1 Tax=Bursaphelenchus xylophilus TaxID=6326 RepID=A0A1I7RQ30_BURXY|nr:unnamed protein product [Bursaphelenchus xylophilus]CAG9097059.1 unnamed protein product [Bursaphelenchus xylophilus]
MVKVLEKKIAMQTIPEALLRLMATKFGFNMDTVNGNRKTFKLHINDDEATNRLSQTCDDKFLKPEDVFAEATNEENYATIASGVNENVFEAKENDK